MAEISFGFCRRKKLSSMSRDVSAISRNGKLTRRQFLVPKNTAAENGKLIEKTAKPSSLGAEGFGDLANLPF